MSYGGGYGSSRDGGYSGGGYGGGGYSNGYVFQRLFFTVRDTGRSVSRKAVGSLEHCFRVTCKATLSSAAFSTFVFLKFLAKSISNSNGYSGGGYGGSNGYSGGGGGYGGGGGDKMSNLGAGLKTQTWGRSLWIPARQIMC